MPAASRAVLQVHPTRRCNLTCRHCYSDSGPGERAELPLPMLERLARDAAVEGYRTLSVSGGEPLMYGPLPDLLAAGKSAGMTTTVTTNGTLLEERRLRPLVGKLGLLAMSLDGVPAAHDTMRGSARAFERLSDGLSEVRAMGIPFGFVFTLTQHNVNELRWVAQFARDAGAALLQIHPLELVGRAATELSTAEPDARERGWAWIEALGLQAMHRESLAIQLDLASADSLSADPRLGFAAWPEGDVTTLPLAELVNPLVLEADATLVPLTYGFPRRLALGSLATDDLPALSLRWRERYGEFVAHCRDALDRAGDKGLLSWYAEVARESVTTAPP